MTSFDRRRRHDRLLTPRQDSMTTHEACVSDQKSQMGSTMQYERFYEIGQPYSVQQMRAKRLEIAGSNSLPTTNCQFLQTFTCFLFSPNATVRIVYVYSPPVGTGRHPEGAGLCLSYSFSEVVDCPMAARSRLWPTAEQHLAAK